MHHTEQRVQSFQEALDSLRRTDISVSIFEDFRLEVSTNHPAKDIRLKSYYGNRTSKFPNNFILIQKNDIIQEDNFNVKDSSLDDSIREDDNQHIVGENLTDLSIDSVMDMESTSSFKPVSINNARLLMFLYTQCLRKSSDDTPICVLCDGQDPEKTNLLEALPVRQESCLIGVMVTTVSSSGPLHTKSELMTMNQLTKKASYSTTGQCATYGFAQYDIMETCYQDISMPNQNQSQTTVKLDCSWEDVKHILETPHGAKCTVHIKAVSGDSNSAAHGIYNELCALAGFASGTTLGQIQWMKTESTATSTIEVKLAQLIEMVKQGEKVQHMMSEENSNHESSPLRTKLIRERQDLDFTEQLWLLLKDNARCYDDILSSMKQVLGELHSGQLQPMVHSSNCTSLAKHIRASYQHNMTLSVKDLEGLEPLRMLVEIGVDKLKRDYLAHFIGQELTTLDKLQWYLCPSNANDLSLEELVRRLQNLHCVMELHVVGATSLNLPHKTLWTLIRSGLAFYEREQHTGHHTFSLQVDRSAMLRFYSSFQPSVWRVEVKGASSGLDQTRTLYQVATKKTFEHITGYLKSTSALDQTDVDSDIFTLYETIATTSHMMLF